MASAAQVKALLRSHIEGDDERFYSVAMQMAAHEAKMGHGNLAKELRGLIDKAKALASQSVVGSPVLMARPKGELSGLLAVSYPKFRLKDMVLSSKIEERLQRIYKRTRKNSEVESP